MKLCSKLYKRVPNRRDSDYFDSYENPHWKQTPFFLKVSTRSYQFLYFLSGPKFLVPFIGTRSKTSRPTSYQRYIFFQNIFER